MFHGSGLAALEGIVVHEAIVLMRSFFLLVNDVESHMSVQELLCFMGQGL